MHCTRCDTSPKGPAKDKRHRINPDEHTSDDMNNDTGMKPTTMKQYMDDNKNDTKEHDDDWAREHDMMER